MDPARIALTVRFDPTIRDLGPVRKVQPVRSVLDATADDGTEIRDASFQTALVGDRALPVRGAGQRGGQQQNPQQQQKPDQRPQPQAARDATAQITAAQTSAGIRAAQATQATTAQFSLSGTARAIQSAGFLVQSIAQQTLGDLADRVDTAAKGLHRRASAAYDRVQSFLGPSSASPEGVAFEGPGFGRSPVNLTV